VVTGPESSYSYIQGMSRALSPIESEFATVEEAYDRWFRAKVETAWPAVSGCPGQARA